MRNNQAGNEEMVMARETRKVEEVVRGREYALIISGEGSTLKIDRTGLVDLN